MTFGQCHKITLVQCWADGHFNIGPTSQNDVGPFCLTLAQCWRNLVLLMGQCYEFTLAQYYDFMLVQRHNLTLGRQTFNVGSTSLNDVGTML